ncbi:MAG: glycosyltransferase family A protein [Candidatus Bathyarchaeia archaeon]
MNSHLNYIVLMSTRDGGELLNKTLKSLTSQTSPPKLFSIIIDGGDVDASIEIIRKSCSSISYTIIEHRGIRYVEKDVRRIPENLNEAYEEAVEKLKPEEFRFLLISGDDCVYPRDYAESLVNRMLRDSAVVASGACDPASSMKSLREVYPPGSGRMIRHDYWLKIGASFPKSYGWETWLLYRAEMDNEKIKVYPDLRFHHMHPRGRTHGFHNWGRARYLLGYHPLYMLGRTAADLLDGNPPIPRWGTLKMLLGYLVAPLILRLGTDPYMKPLTDIRGFVHYKQLKTIKTISSKI